MKEASKTEPKSPEASLEAAPAVEREWNRRRFLRTGLGTVVGAGSLPALSGRAQAAGSPLDITFIQVGDPHYRAFDATNNNFNSIIRSNIQKMMALTAASDMPGAGTMGTPLGVINVGDLIDAGNETDPSTGQAVGGTATREGQWANYVKDFGLLGNEPDSLVKYPVYEGYGNHDQDGFLKQVNDRIAARAAQLPNLTGQSGSFTYVGAYGNITVSGVHFAWKWGPVHFVSASMRVGNDSKRYPCSGSHAFLKNYLETVVGTSGDPVFVATHLPPSTGAEGDWPLADRQAFYDLIRQYNVVGILVGHVHSYAYFDWRGPDGTGDVPIKVYQCDALHHSGTTQGIFTVFRILGDPNDATKATIHMAQRLRNNSWGLSASRQITLSGVEPPPPPPPVTGLTVSQWQSVNLHNGTALGIPMSAGVTSVEPRQAGIRQIEVLFAEPVTVTNLTTAVTITGVTQSGAVSSLSALGITANVVLSGGNTLVITFSNGGGPVALPDAAKWRFTLNPAVIAGTGGAVLTASVATTRVIAGLVGDFDGNGRVSGIDLNEISNTTAFDSAIVDCLRADIDGDGVIGAADLTAAWANRSKRTDNLPNPA